MMTAITAITAEVASIPAQAAPPVPGAPTSLNPLPPVPAEPVQPILFGDFDANGDGVNDFIMVKAPDSVSPLPRVGVVSGADSSVLFVIYGDAADTAFGLIATGAGDVNNDGFDDVLITIMTPSSNDSQASITVRVYSGLNGAPLLSLNGEQSNDGFGMSAAPAGDTNGDGFDDILIGAPRYDSPTAIDVGMFLIVSGRDGSILDKEFGQTTGSSLGMATAGLGDVDGDGLSDYAVETISKQR